MQDWGMTLIQGHNYMYVIACCYILGVIQLQCSNNHVGPSTPFHTQWLFFLGWVLFYLMQDMLALNKVQGPEGKKFPLSQLQHQLGVERGFAKRTCMFKSKQLYTTDQPLSAQKSKKILSKKYKITWSSFKHIKNKTYKQTWDVTTSANSTSLVTRIENLSSLEPVFRHKFSVCTLEQVSCNLSSSPSYKNIQLFV